MRTLLSGLLLATLASVLSPVPAPAKASGVTATVSGESQRAVAGRCATYLVQYALNLPSDATSWQADISTGPGEYPSVSLRSFYDDAPAGVESLRLCTYDDADLNVRLFLTGRYDTADSYYNEISGTGTMRLKRGVTRTRLKVSTTTPRFNQGVRLSVRTESRGEYGYYPFPGADVELQVRHGSRWVSGKGFEFLTGQGGKDSVAYRWTTRKTITFRLVLPAQGGGRRAVSNVVTVNPRG